MARVSLRVRVLRSMLPPRVLLDVLWLAREKTSQAIMTGRVPRHLFRRDQASSPSASSLERIVDRWGTVLWACPSIWIWYFEP